jgi:intein/homing endonuclease
MQWEQLDPHESNSKAQQFAMRLNALGSLFYFSKIVLKRNRLSNILHRKIAQSLESEHLHLVLEIPRDHLKCLSEEQEVLVESGEYKRAATLTVGDVVLSVSDDFKLQWTRIQAVQHNPPQSCVEIRFRSGRNLCVSENHPFRKLLSWERADGLKTKDRIAISGNVHPPKASEISPYAEILGWFLGDGSFRCNTVTNSVRELREQIISAAIRAGGTAHEKTYKNRAPAVRVQGLRPLWKRLGLVGHTARNKFIPTEIFKSRTEDIAGLLRGLFGSDATLNSNVGIVLTTKSERLARDVQRLLLRFDINSRVAQIPCNKFWNVTVSASDQIERFIRRIGWVKTHWFDRPYKTTWANNVPKEWRDLLPRVSRGKRNGPFFQLRKLGIRVDTYRYDTSKHKLRAVANAMGNELLLNLSTDDLYWDEVLSVTPVGKKPTVDIQTETGNYCVSDVVTHNTTLVTESLSMWWALPFNQRDEIAMCELGYDDDWIRWMKIAHNPDTRTLIVSENEGNAIRFGKRIDSHYQSGDFFRKLFPEILPNASCTWNDKSKVHKRTASGIGEGTFDFLGVGGAVQSRHYDRIIEDDLVGRDAKNSELVMNDTIEYHRLLSGVFDTAAHAKELGDEVIVGNRWSFYDLNGWIRQNDVKHQYKIETHSAEGGCCEDHPPGTPIYFTTELLEEVKARNTWEDYAHQYLNLAVLPEECPFRPEWLRYYELYETTDKRAAIRHEVKDGITYGDIPVGLLSRKMIVDLNHSEEKGRAHHGIVVVGFDSETDRQYLLDVWARATSYDELVVNIYKLAKRWRLQDFYVEKIAAQQLLRFPVEYRSRVEDYRLTMREIVAPRARNAKDDRIRAMEPNFRQSKFWCRRDQSQFLEEYKTYPSCRTKDVLDCLGYANSMFDNVRYKDVVLAVNKWNRRLREASAAQ